LTISSSVRGVFSRSARTTALFSALPNGTSLPAEAWARRHRGIVALLSLHAVGLPLFGITQGYGLVQSLAYAAPVAALAIAAVGFARRRTLAAALASGGLLTASAVLVDLSGGLIEAHFHFFVMIAVITLYEHWTPFLLAFLYVVVHHGLIGTLDAHSVYNHSAAQADPWRWAVVHGIFVAGAGAANVVAWRLNEDVRAERRRESERAHMSEERFSAIVESSDDAILGKGLDGVITSWNAAAERLYGYRPHEVIGQPATILMPPDRLDEETTILETVKAGRRVRHYDTKRLKKDGTVVDVSLAVSPIRSRDGKVVGASSIARDVTERKKAEAERERLLAREREQNDRLRELDRLKDGLVASVSHELRTPLTSIRGYAELLLDREAGELNDDQEQFLTVIDRNSDRLLRVIGDLLFVAQVDAGKFALERADVDLAELARESVNAARPNADAKAITVHLDADGVSEIYADRSRLAQALDNLLSNAIKFTPEGGRVDVRLSAAGGAMVVEVRDTGIGIPPDEQEKLFERFFRTKGATDRAIQGTGLGLSITKAIAEAHGGTISLESAEGVGTTFRIELPVSPPASALADTPPEPVVVV
jgi:PAS domain S-box-containing protein